MKKSTYFLLLRREGYSMAELVTAAAVVGVLSTVGVKSYQAQTNRARTAEAKQSLAYVYTSEQSFRDNWRSYHENLVAVGAVPSGQYHYDVGFDSATALSTSDGDLGSYPTTQVLSQSQCTNFNQICQGSCSTAIVSAIGGTYASAYAVYGTASCAVRSTVLLSGTGKYSNSNGQATTTSFKALAVGRLKNRDVWSIDDERTLEHIEDGT